MKTNTYAIYNKESKTAYGRVIKRHINRAEREHDGRILVTYYKGRKFDYSRSFGVYVTETQMRALAPRNYKKLIANGHCAVRLDAWTIENTIANVQ